MRKDKERNLLKLKKYLDERGVVSGDNGEQFSIVDGKDILRGGEKTPKKKEGI